MSKGESISFMTQCPECGSAGLIALVGFAANGDMVFVSTCVSPIEICERLFFFRRFKAEEVANSIITAEKFNLRTGEDILPMMVSITEGILESEVTRYIYSDEPYGECAIREFEKEVSLSELAESDRDLLVEEAQAFLDYKLDESPCSMCRDGKRHFRHDDETINTGWETK